MKVTRATIGLKVNKAKVDGAGWVPVSLVVCFKGRVVRSTGVKVLLKYWDARRESVKAAHPNAVVVNNSLWDMKHSLEERRDVLESRGVPYAAADLFEVDDMVDVSAEIDCGCRFNALLEDYVSAHGVSAGTYETYRYAGSVFMAWCGVEDMDLRLLDFAKVKKFGRWMSDVRGLTDGTISQIYTKLFAILHWGQEKGLLDHVPEFEYKKRYGISRRYYCLEEGVVKRVLGALRDEYADKINYYHIKKVPGALALFGAMWMLNGIAPIDITMLRRENVGEKVIDGVRYWSIEYKRKKTVRQVKALLRQDDLMTQMLFGKFLDTCESRGGWVFPILLRDGMSESSINDRKSNVLVKLKRWFLEWCSSEGIEVNREEFCFYTVRHTYASVYANKPGASLRGLASLMGRSVSNIETYVHQLSEDSDLVKASEVVGF